LNTDNAYLIRLAGPALERVVLQPRPGGLRLGRHDDCEIRLPASVEKVSRFHARFDHTDGHWHLTDPGSSWGTFVNGVRLGKDQSIPLNEGDLIRITPWTFNFTHKDVRQRGLDSVDDSSSTHTLVRTHTGGGPRLADEMLSLLLESAAGIHAASDEMQLANVVLEEARRGTHLPNAAWLRPVDAEGRIEVRAAQRASALPLDAAQHRRSLLNKASAGVGAEPSE